MCGGTEGAGMMRFLQHPIDDVELPPKPQPLMPSPAEVIARRQEAWDQDQREKDKRRKDAAKADAAERMERQNTLQEIAQKRQAEFVRTRDELRSELSNARAAQARYQEAPIDLSSVDTAIKAVQAVSLRDAADQLVKKAERALASHENPQGRR